MFLFSCFDVLFSYEHTHTMYMFVIQMYDEIAFVCSCVLLFVYYDVFYVFSFFMCVCCD